MKIHLALGLLLMLPSLASAQTAKSRANFERLVKKNYSVDFTNLSPRQIAQTEKSLDKFWEIVKKNKKEYLPLLRAGVQNPKSNKFFRFDGANLLVSIDPSVASKKLLIDTYLATDLKIIHPDRWLQTMAWLGKDGFDISQAALRGLTDPKYQYTQPEHGDFKISNFVGALILFGSMSEEKSTPVLVKIVNNPKHPQREAALSILADQATPEAFKTIEDLDASTFSPQFQEIIENYRTYPVRIVPRDKPLTSRAEFLRAFQELVKGDGTRFKALVDKVQDGERDVVAVMKPEDLPLLRKVRRVMIARANPHAISYYDTFTDIIMTLVRKNTPEPKPQVL